MKPAPNSSEDLQKAIAQWRKRHQIREDEAILLCLELFQIHQQHWDELRRRELPSFAELRDNLNQLRSSTILVRREAAALLDELRRYESGRKLTAPSVAGVIATGIIAVATGILIGKFLL